MTQYKSDLWLKVEGWCEPKDAIDLVLEETSKQKQNDSGDSKPAFDLGNLQDLLKHVQRVQMARDLLTIRKQQQTQMSIDQANSMRKLAGAQRPIGMERPLIASVDCWEF